MPTVLLLGMGPTALDALESLSAVCDVVGVVRDVDPEHAAGDQVALRAKQLGVPLIVDTAPAAVEALVGRLRPDCLVISSFNRILRPRLLDSVACVNVHYAPLPQYRGRANVNWAIINDEPETAITIHLVAPGLDAGNILFQQRLPLGERDTVEQLYRRLNAVQREWLGRTVLRMLDGWRGEPQAESEATYGCTRLPEDGEIRWEQSTRSIDCLIRGLTAPYPGAFTYAARRRMMVWRAEPLADPPRYVGRIPGRVVNIDRAGGFVDVLTGDGVLRLIDVQLAGEAPSSAASIITSVRTTLGLRTSDLLERIEYLERMLSMGHVPPGGGEPDA